ncbi:drug/metabolite transporter (DMT)-like permease [Roseibium hamelinense]|uniref:Drug/metabolite transporter (DMT)-like permease n=1 Tax=Roseibium hamelinense TaxID=150831 RepID=A0A562THN4_9HYPH|nr:DMT family transporter [Roseibium hamelinense]MTI45666.1 DMT family transporter [Roseibium hamelinense]TWI93151.1 drug/metabolite transporter (DMT)-like permease [Roseibium hamelinense]
MTEHSRYALRENTPLAVGLALCGIALFTPVFAAGKIAEGTVPALVLVWLRFFGGALTLGAAGIVKGAPEGGYISRHWRVHLLRAAFAIGGLGGMIYAGAVLPVADAAAIGLTKGMMAIGLAALILRETVVARHWLSGVFCALGALLVVRSVSGDAGAAAGVPADGVLAALIGAFCMACEALVIRYLAQREGTVVMLTYVNCAAALLLGVPVLWIALHQGIDWSVAGWFVLLGPCAIIGQSFNVAAYRRAGAATLAPVGYAWVLFAALLGYLLFNEVPALEAGAGAALIVLGGLILTLKWPLRGLKGRA